MQRNQLSITNINFDFENFNFELWYVETFPPTVKTVNMCKQNVIVYAFDCGCYVKVTEEALEKCDGAITYDTECLFVQEVRGIVVVEGDCPDCTLWTTY